MELAKPMVKLGPGPTVSTAKAPKMKMKKAGEDTDKRQINYLIFGESETGKSATIAQIASMDLKTFAIFTDLGNDNGISGAQVYSNLRKTPEKFKSNVAWVSLEDIDTIREFLDDPAKVVEGFWDFNPDFLVWDGFSFFQQMYIMPEVEEVINKDDSSEGRMENYQGWGMTKNRTIRASSDFLGIKNPNGKALHKVVTTAVKYGSEKTGPDKTEVKAKHEMDISGAASRIIRHGFDVVFETIRSGEKFEYAFNISAATKRRFTLPDKMEADFTKLHNNVVSQIS